MCGPLDEEFIGIVILQMAADRVMYNYGRVETASYEYDENSGRWVPA